MKQRIVIKLGGSSLESPTTLQELAGLIQGYRKKRCQVFVVHGGGPAINQELTRQGISWKFIDGQRQTTPEMMGVIDDVLSRQINSMLVQSLKDARIPAVGLSGANDKILFCQRAQPNLMQVGLIQMVNLAAVESVLDLFGSPVPVIAPLGTDAQGMQYNINADWAATHIAVELKAKKLIFLTDQQGILDRERNLVRETGPLGIQRLIEEGTISGGMLTKVRAMTMALNLGVKQVRVLHASQARLLLQGLNDKCAGTLLTPLQKRQKDVMHGRAS